MSQIFGFLLACCFFKSLAFGAREVYNIAHMTNTPAAVEWAVTQGANGVEADLFFDSETGELVKFYHGFPCDCTCLCLFGCPSESVCDSLEETSPFLTCSTKVSISELLSTMARQSQLAVIVIDSKEIGDMDTQTMVIAGRAVVDAIIRYLFQKGYGGHVVIGSSYETTLPYLRSAVETVNNTPYANRVFFALDMLDIDKSLHVLHTLPTRNFIYGTGESTCSPRSLNSTTLQLAAMNIHEGTVGLTYIWTVDRELTMKDNLPYVTAIMSNYPGRVRDVIQQSGLQLASKDQHIPAATSGEIISKLPQCNCRYHSNGCRIDMAVSSEQVACHCKYIEVYIENSGYFKYCQSSIALCIEPESIYCKHSDTSKESCLQGGGDCEGY